MSELLRVNGNVLLTEVGAGQAVLLHLDTKFYYTLNETGIAVWKKLAAASASLRMLAEELSNRFRIDTAAAERDLEPLLEEMIAEGLVSRCK